MCNLFSWTLPTGISLSLLTVKCKALVSNGKNMLKNKHCYLIYANLLITIFVQGGLSAQITKLNKDKEKTMIG